MNNNRKHWVSRHHNRAYRLHKLKKYWWSIKTERLTIPLPRLQQEQLPLAGFAMLIPHNALIKKNNSKFGVMFFDEQGKPTEIIYKNSISE